MVLLRRFFNDRNGSDWTDEQLARSLLLREREIRVELLNWAKRTPYLEQSL